MKMTHTYRSRARHVKKPRRRLLLASLLGVLLLLFCGYNIIPFHKDTPTLSVGTNPSRTPLAKNVQLAWPAVGQAAVGSVEDGFLAHSSDTEALRPIASMAKVIAALAIMKKQPLESEQASPSYVLTAKDVTNYHTYVSEGGSVLPVYEGMVLTQYQAMQAMLIPSANNIAKMLTERVFGSEEAYVSYARDMLRHMGCSRTVVADASGFSPATVSTPSELVTIGIAALKNPVIAEIVDQSQAQIPGVGIVKNTNELLGTDGVVGIKTGTTGSAGSCLLFAARYTTEKGQEVTLIGVIMDDADATSLFSDSKNLLESAKQSFGLVETQPEGDAVIRRD
ncbi:MAG: hypothetical protein JWP06_863 [Candidatus Saccharibacteria bacterium]|nr:hypothetical protein [Candidatus Saccharibacteria bacterium]